MGILLSTLTRVEPWRAQQDQAISREHAGSLVCEERLGKGQQEALDCVGDDMGRRSWSSKPFLWQLSALTASPRQQCANTCMAKRTWRYMHAERAIVSELETHELPNKVPHQEEA